MKKKNGIIVLVIVLLVAVIAGVGYKIADKFYAPLVQTKAVSYLCHKYDAKSNEFEMVDYNQAHITLDEYEIFFLKPRWVDFSFEYVYNGRHFVVCKKNGTFYDDYQFDDIQEWCTEWLKENVDERIIGFEFNTDDILYYLSAPKKGYGYIISKDDAKDFLLRYKSFGDYNVFYYYDSNGSNYYGVDEELSKEIGSKLQMGDRASAEYTDKSVNKKIDKFREYSWSSWNMVKEYG